MYLSRMFVVLGLVIVGVLSRLLPHPPNFTSVNAIALFGAFYFDSKWLSFATVVVTLLFSDLAIGFYPTMSFVYLSFGLIVLMGSKLKKDASFGKITITSLASSTLSFFATQVIGDLSYGLLLFGLLNLYKSGFKGFEGIITHGKN